MNNLLINDLLEEVIGIESTIDAPINYSALSEEELFNHIALNIGQIAVENDFGTDTIAFSMLNALNVGTESAIAKGRVGRMLSALRRAFTLRPGKREQLRARDLNLLTTSSIKQEGTQSTFDYGMAVDLITRIRWTNMGNLEGEKKELLDLVKLLYKHRRVTYEVVLPTWFSGLISLSYSQPLACVSFVIVILICNMMEYKLLEKLAPEEIQELIKALSQMVAKIYKNGTGKSARLQKDGTISAADAQSYTNELIKMFADSEKKWNDTERTKVALEYQDKVKIVELFKSNNAMIQQKVSNIYSRDALAMMAGYSYAAKERGLRAGTNVDVQQMLNYGEFLARVAELDMSNYDRLCQVIKTLYKF